MNTLTANPTEVNPDDLDTADEDVEFNAWLAANADRLAEQAETDSMIETIYRHF